MYVTAARKLTFPPPSDMEKQVVFVTVYFELFII